MPRRARPATSADLAYMRQALALARHGYGSTSPNPMVGALLVKRGRVIGQGWHRRAGEPHAEIEALNDAQARGAQVKGATLYVTLEPCSTQGRTPPCTDAILAAGISRVVAGATDPNPAHRGRAFGLLKRGGVAVTHGVLTNKCQELNEAFNHWIAHRTPFVTVKAAMTLDGKIATARGESKWITGPAARSYGMRLRAGADAILVGINTILADDPALTVRGPAARRSRTRRQPLRRIILDSRARTPLLAKVVTDELASATIIVVTRQAPKNRVAALRRFVDVLVAPGSLDRINLKWLLKVLGAKTVTSLLVEGGSEVNGSFLLERLAHRVAFFYAPMILGGRAARRAVGGSGARCLEETLGLSDVKWRNSGPDLLLTARVASTT
jgi:diaminohydroxyphosphoribosylaminopyrimidine deaminase / 5-amino-6-(5-phosphoribosylamino)uracil reductase